MMGDDNMPLISSSAPGNLRSLIIAVFFAAAWIPSSLLAAGDGGGAMQSANIDVSNIASLQRGARNFVNYCMGCHSAQYVRYNRVARDLGISEDQLIENLMFAADKPQDTMTVAMPARDAQRWFGQPPPDLSLIARSRGTDFLYSFLKAF